MGILGKILVLGTLKPSDNSQLSQAANNLPHNTGMDIPAILNWVYAFAGIVAVGFIVHGAINYVTTQGDPGKIKQAGQTIAFALVGLAVVLVAAAITNFIAGAAS